MDKNTVTVELPDRLRSFVDERLRLGDYADAGEYLRDLVRRDREEQAGKRLRELIEEGLASGPATPLTESEVARIRARVAATGR